MKLKIETMDWVIWIFVIVPFFGVVFYFFGVERGLLALFLIPVAIYLKNTYIKEHFAWKPAYRVGVEAFDDDHKKLFELMYEMYEALTHIPSKGEARTVLMELEDYTKTHFAREEELMKKHEYPDIDEHCAQHEEMVKKIGEFLEEFDEKDVEVSKEALHYIENWLINHIGITDKKYTDFFNAKGEH